MSQLNAGQQFRPTRGTDSGDVTVGKLYTVEGTDDEGVAYFIDDAGDQNFAIGSGHSGEGFPGNLYPDGYTVE